ncbi:MAG: cupin domain-containing protein [Phycisphaerales bacterium]|jgi:quercetin dioxygenase-like cupin family protein|nr:cupin domain-containing protein [Phycisphaerales bacterium]MDP7087290.1 cupin domain-containing protein [Phycisphaerales bacterium]MDP7189941.1 cupin domain-containing protein [Phycisphaerales bacterium]MDP7519149.1 cupin domain-containing protein [Phycisphaerales bacterium]MDP7575291.1 cupin domain-containing protein [Phycisphaerales bacterium]|tara:strand:+ start:650 stop:1018 length:369 start_codon:yes stop_codon:yes gene_type:complete
MLVRRCDPTNASEVSVEGASGVAMQMLMGRADAAPNFAMRHFVVAPGGHTPRHSHPWEHEVYVTEGVLRTECGGESIEVFAGDALLIPGDATHQFVNESDAQARFLCMVPLESECGRDVPGS